jgi:hypothetical protein
VLPVEVKRTVTCPLVLKSFSNTATHSHHLVMPLLLEQCCQGQAALDYSQINTIDDENGIIRDSSSHEQLF